MKKSKKTKVKSKQEKFLTELSHLCGKYKAQLHGNVVSFFDKSGEYESQVKLHSVYGGVNAMADFVVLPKEMREAKSEWILPHNKETRKWERGKFSEM